MVVDLIQTKRDPVHVYQWLFLLVERLLNWSESKLVQGYLMKSHLFILICQTIQYDRNDIRIITIQHVLAVQGNLPINTR